MYEVLLIFFLIIAVFLVAAIMLQRNQGSDIGPHPESGISNTLFGSGSSSNYGTRLTSILATLFFIFSLALSNITFNTMSKKNKLENLDTSVKMKIEHNQVLPLNESITDIPQ